MNNEYFDEMINGEDLKDYPEIYFEKLKEAKQAQIKITELLGDLEEKVRDFYSALKDDDVGLKRDTARYIDFIKEYINFGNGFIANNESFDREFYSSMSYVIKISQAIKDGIKTTVGTTTSRFAHAKDIVEITKQIEEQIFITQVNRRTNQVIALRKERDEKKALRAARAPKVNTEAVQDAIPVYAPAAPTKQERMRGVAQAYSDIYEICTLHMIKAQDLRLQAGIARARNSQTKAAELEAKAKDFEAKARNLEAKVKTLQAKLFNNDAKRVLVKDENPDYGRKNFDMFIQPYVRDAEGRIALNEQELDDETLARMEDRIATSKKLINVVYDAAR